MRFILASLVVFSTWCSEALACSCARDSGDQRAAVTSAFSSADIVFVGRIESKDRFRRKENNEVIEFEYERTQFYVVDSWKGERAARVYVESNVTCCLCGYQFPRSGDFLIYASGPDENGYYATSICTRTKEVEAAKEEIEILNSLAAEDGRTKRSSRSRDERAPAER